MIRPFVAGFINTLIIHFFRLDATQSIKFPFSTKEHLPILVLFPKGSVHRKNILFKPSGLRYNRYTTILGRDFMESLHRRILDGFCLDAEPVSCERYGFGHINETYLVVTQTKHRYILQKINCRIFRDVPALMANISAVTTYLRRLQADKRRELTLVSTRTGDVYLAHTDGSFWRVYEFIEDSLCLQAPETPEDFYQSAVAFGHFQQQLQDWRIRPSI